MEYITQTKESIQDIFTSLLDKGVDMLEEVLAKGKGPCFWNDRKNR